MKKLVSVIMSTKDTVENMLRSAIESILNQSYKNFEFLIMCDGGEKDYEIVSSYNDERIKIFRHLESKGLASSLNELIRESKGEYIARMDSDDISLKNRLEEEIVFLEANPEVNICGTVAKKFGNENSFCLFNYLDYEGIKAQLFLYNPIIHPSVMIRKSFIENNNILYNCNFKYSQDFELWSRCCKMTKIQILPKVALLYRTHNKQISKSKLEEQNKLCGSIYLNNLKELKVNNAEDKVEHLLFLAGRSNKTCTTENLIELIEEILEKNNRILMYDKKKLRNTLYFNLFIQKLKKEHVMIPLRILLTTSIIPLILKRIFLVMRYKFTFSKE